VDRFLVALAVVLAFGVGLAGGLSGRSPGDTKTVTATTVEVLNGQRSAGSEPAPIPTLLEGVDPRHLELSRAIPQDAELLSADPVSARPRQLVVTWRRAHLTADGNAEIWARNGVAIWQLDRGDSARWHRVYTRETVLGKVSGIQGYSVTLGDVSGDARPEVLLFEDRDGTAGNGTYRLLANAGPELRQAFTKTLAQDKGTIKFGPHRLVVLEGLGYFDRGPHCCYRKVRETWLRWDGRRTKVVHEAVHRNRRGWPPG
jgi:hypothetical protein